MARVRGLRDRRFQVFVDAAVEQGWRVERNGSDHLQIRPPGGGKGVWISMSLDSKDPRGFLNTRAALRRLGLQV